MESTDRIPRQATSLAIALAGGQSVVASQLKIRRQAVWKWEQKGRVPANKVLILCDLVAHQVTPQQLRPDVFGQPAPREAQIADSSSS